MKRNQQKQNQRYYFLETDAIVNKAFYLYDTSKEIAIEWALDTLKAQKATHRGPQKATLYRGWGYSKYFEKVQTFKREYDKQ